MPKASRRRSAWARKLALSLVILVIADVVGAQLLNAIVPPRGHYRIASPTYNHGFAQMVDAVDTWGNLRFRMRTNSLGFKDATNREVPPQRAPGHRRVVLIGDSFTEGIGYEYDQTFAGILARELADERIEVLNAGVTLYAPAIYYRKTKFLVEDVGLEFDELVVFIDLSDIQEEAQFYDIDEHDRVTMHVPVWASAWIGNVTAAQRFRSMLKRNSVVIRFADLVLDAFTNEATARPAALPSGPALDEPRALWTVDDKWFEEFGRVGLEKARRDMDRLTAFLAGRGIALTIVVYPWPDQVVRRDLESRQVTSWREWADERGARFVNLFPAFFEADPATVLQRYYIPGDMHFNAAGNQLIAAEFLERCDLTK
jgi:lysophospholipase L1-like esterase